MQIIVINRAQDTDRRTNIERQFQELNVECRFFEAVEGMSLQDECYQNHPGIPYDQKMALQICGRELSPAEMGCSLSHLMLYSQMLKSGAECLCILEDDAVVTPTIPDILREIEMNPDLEMVLLGHFSRSKWSYGAGAETTRLGRVRLSGEIFAAKPVEFPLATCGYVIKRSAARKLFDYGTPLRLPPDWLTGAAEGIGISLYVCTPPAVLVEPGLHSRSTIGDRMGGLKAAIDSEEGFKKLIARIVHSAKALFRALFRCAGRLGIARTSYVWIFNRRGLTRHPGWSRNAEL